MAGIARWPFNYFHDGCATVNRGTDCVSTLFRRSAPEQGAGLNVVHRLIRLRQLDQRMAPVSTTMIQPLKTLPSGPGF